MIKRQIVQIDEEKCDGCGLCVPSCEEGAIRIVDGKARLVSDVYCDGLGACLGHCPRGAISIVEREALPFDEAAVASHIGSTPSALPVLEAVGAGTSSGCPGMQARQLRPPKEPSRPVRSGDFNNGAKRSASQRSGLANWPVQLHLVPPSAPYLRGAHLLLAADCAPLAVPDFHQRFLDGRPVLIGCPKLDDGQFYVQKLAQIVRTAAVREITVIRMEVPCCSGLTQIARAAIRLAGSGCALHEEIVSCW